ncbi:predicted protein [Lichtheimia corymbifera JMRC:FSU:9682]|uniref:Uncharacterized protein n=1 Tax=Lichtheimia corymbifera JMRC:FSU:9682 TaxID=1263082 RepID=A0A068RF37_9FUNG|nr:predicted protein [Lichtheimia corymbifera JMRC:FSU:9682]
MSNSANFFDNDIILLYLRLYCHRQSRLPAVLQGHRDGEGCATHIIQQLVGGINRTATIADTYTKRFL